jgi:protein-S-isoprenylcysteine O-methyltransferase Ste14
MQLETVFRLLFVLSFIAMMAIRLFYQSKVLRDSGRLEIKEGAPSLVAGSIAALVTIVFGAEYIVSPGFFWFAYVLAYPNWVRWLGAIILASGIVLLWASHHHLGRSFHSLIVAKDEQVLVETGPYRLIRHPIYSAYVMNYVGGGLLAGNLVLTFVPVTMFAVLVCLRMGKEEQVLIYKFGQRYIAYMQRTGRLVPRFRARPGNGNERA